MNKPITPEEMKAYVDATWDKCQTEAWIKTNNQVFAMLIQAHDVLALSSLPPKKKWVGLTDEEIETSMPGGIYDCLADPWDCGVGDGDEMRSIKKDVVRIARAIEAKLKEKNHG